MYCLGRRRLSGTAKFVLRLIAGGPLSLHLHLMSGKFDDSKTGNFLGNGFHAISWFR